MKIIDKLVAKTNVYKKLEDNYYCQTIENGRKQKKIHDLINEISILKSLNESYRKGAEEYNDEIKSLERHILDLESQLSLKKKKKTPKK